MKIISANLAVYGTAHLVVDMISIGVLFSITGEGLVSADIVPYLYIGYNLLAFGLQVFAGFITDYFKAPRIAALIGLILTGVSTFFLSPAPILAVITAGIGNAIFHVGGGVISLHLTPQKATAPGVFVAPGALGVTAGILLGNSGVFNIWPFLVIVAVLSILIFMVKKPQVYNERTQIGLKQNIKFEYIIYLVLFVIAVRSLVGFAVAFPWKSETTLLFLLTLSVVLGKGLGGYLADRFGWAKVAIGSLLVSIPLLILGVNIPALGIAGMFLFNITMPVTLTLVSNVLPGSPGTAFGLTCMALLLGTLPASSVLKTGLGNNTFISVLIVISAVTLFLVLRYYYQKQNMDSEKTRTTG